MIRKTFTMTEETDALLGTLTITSGAASQSEVVRRAIESWGRQLQLRDRIADLGKENPEVVKALALLDSIIDG